MSTEAPVRFAEKLAWSFFDFANSSFTTIITTVVYAPYFTQVMVGKEGFAGLTGDMWWAIALAASYLVVIATAPLLGTRADHFGNKKRYLFASYLVCVVATCSLSVLPPLATLPAVIIVGIATIAFSTGENIVAGFLPELAPPEEMGRLSALGWSLGYFGGLLSLAIALAMVKDLLEWVPAATGVFFLLAGLPTFLVLKERKQPSPGRVPPVFSVIIRPLKERKHFADFITFLVAITAFQAGIAIVIAFATIFAEEEMGMAKNQSILLFIALQLAAAIGAYGFGKWQDKAGSRRAIMVSLATWVMAAVLAGAASNVPTFMVAAVFAGIGMGSSQSASRALVGLFCPRGREAEWFGLWGVATKAASVMGLVAFIAARQWLDLRACILGTIVFFLLGMVLVAGVDVERGRAAARVV